MLPGWGLRKGPSGMLVTPNNTNANMTATMPLQQAQHNTVACDSTAALTIKHPQISEPIKVTAPATTALMMCSKIMNYI